MKIIVLHPHFAYPRGASKFILEVGERLAKNNLDVLIVTIMADRKVIEPYSHLKFYFLGGPRTDSLFYWLTFPIFQLRLHRVLNGIQGSKILFPQVMPANWWAFIYHKFHPDVPLVWMCQEPSAFIHSLPVINSLKLPFRILLKLLRPVLGVVDKWLVNEANVVIANSRYGNSLVKNVYGRKADAMAYPSVDSEKFKPNAEKGGYIFTISRLDKQKGIDILLKAYARLPDSLKKDHQLLIGGEGQEKQNLINLAKTLKIEQFVKFIGVVPESELPALYAKASLVVFTALAEPFGIVPLEAMSCGTPVIANRGGGTQETLVDGQTGFLIEPSNAGALEEKMTYLLRHESVLKEMGLEARIHVEKNFSWDKTAAKIEKIFTDL